LETQNPQLQLAAAEKWLKRHPDDSTLLESLGDICCQLRFWGKARDYFASALSIDPSPLLHSKLGEVLSQIGEFSAAQDSYKNGLVLGLAIDVKD
jgi:HemY protein